MKPRFRFGNGRWWWLDRIAIGRMDGHPFDLHIDFIIATAAVEENPEPLRAAGFPSKWLPSESN